MATTTQLILETIVKGTENARAQMKGLMDSVDKLGDKLTAVGKGLTAAVTIPILGLGANMVKLSADAEEAKNKFDAVFGALSTQTRTAFDTMAASVGRSSLKLQDMGSSIGSLISGLGATDEQAAEFSKQTVQMALDAASFNNVLDTDALDAFRAAIAGEAEPLRRMGIDVSQTAIELEAHRQGINKNVQDMTKMEKATLALSIAQRALTSQGALGDAAKTSDSFSNSLKHLQDNIYDLQTSIGDIIKEAVRPFLMSLVKFTDALKNMDGPTKEWIVKIGLVAAAVGPLLLVMGTLANAVAAIASPIGLVTAGLTALAGVFAYTYVTNEDFRKSVNETVVALLKFGSDAFTAIKETVVNIVNTVTAVWDKIKGPVTTVAKFLKDTIVGAFTYIIGEVRDWIKIIADIFSQLWKIIGPFVMFFVKMFQDNFQTIVDFVVNVGNIIFQPIRVAFDVIYGVAKAFFQLLGGDTKGAWETIKKYTMDAWEGIKSFFSNLIGGVINIFKGFFGFIGSAFTQIWDSVGASVTSGFNTVVNTMTGIGQKIVDYFTGLGKSAFEWGSNMINQFVDGIASIPGKLVDTLGSVAGTVKDYLGFGSPTKLGPGSTSDKWMPNLFGMLSNGIAEGAKKIAPVLANVTGIMDSVFHGAANNAGKRGKEISNALAQIPEQVQKIAGPLFDDINQKYDDFFQRSLAFPEKLKKPFEGMYNAFRDTKDKIAEQLGKLKDDFDSNFSDINNSIADTNKKILDLTGTFNQNDQSAGMDLAKRIVDQQNLVADLQAQVSDKTKEINAATEQDKKDSLQKELEAIQTKLSLESAALRRAHDLEREYSDDIREVKKRNRQSDFTNFIDDWNAKQDKALEEYQNEKKKLSDQLKLYERQRDELSNIYLDSYNKINSYTDIANSVYKDAISQQVLATEAGTNLMKQYFDRVAESVTNVAQKINSVKNMKVLSTPIDGTRAAGGAVESGKSYIVGENGMEVFKPSSSGEIIPNYALGSGSGGQTINIYQRIDTLYGNKDMVRELGKEIVKDLARNTSF